MHRFITRCNIEQQQQQQQNEGNSKTVKNTLHYTKKKSIRFFILFLGIKNVHIKMGVLMITKIYIEISFYSLFNRVNQSRWTSELYWFY